MGQKFLDLLQISDNNENPVITGKLQRLTNYVSTNYNHMQLMDYMLLVYIYFYSITRIYTESSNGATKV